MGIDMVRLRRDMDKYEREQRVERAKSANDILDDAFVNTLKMREIDRLAHVAMQGQALLARMRAIHAGPDSILADELEIFTNIARIGKAQILSDAANDFGRR